VPTYLITHEVDDVDQWLGSSKRAEAFGQIGATARTFRDPQGSKRVGLIAEIPVLEAFQQMIDSDVGREAMKHDGVHPDTLVLLEEG